MSRRAHLPTLYLCRPGYEEDLRDELAAKAPPRVVSPDDGAGKEGGRGWLVATGKPPGAPLIFERQRLPAAEFLPGGAWTGNRNAADWAAERFLAKLRPGKPWTLHAFAADATRNDSAQRRMTGVGKALLARCRADFPEIWEAHRPPEEAARRGADWALQIVACDDGVRGALTPFAGLSDPFPGGVHRMRMASQAPSRSYLKIEEALELFGESPRAGQRVVDLGAAPGGWSFAFLRRGCRVVAVDRGAMKVGGLDNLSGRLDHLREDGLRYRPHRGAAPVDWLVSDMLVAPGMTLGLLRKWAERGWMHRFIVNIKIPQREAYPALRPIEAFLSEVSGKSGGMRQLYHDRREVTAWGRIEAAPSAAPSTGKPAGQASRNPPRRAPKGKTQGKRRR